MAKELTRTQHVLAALAATPASVLRPVQVQKLFFLLDKKRESLGKKPRFEFRPYDYGPFDPEVYRELEALENAGLVTIETDWRGLRHYRLTPQGAKEGGRLLQQLDEAEREYAEKAGDWVSKQSFASLVAAIYQKYPEMKVNSVFAD